MAVRTFTLLTLIEFILFFIILLVLTKPNNLCIDGLPVYDANGTLIEWMLNTDDKVSVNSICKEFTFSDYVCKTSLRRKFYKNSQCIELAIPVRFAGLLFITMGLCSINLLTNWHRSFGLTGISSVHIVLTVCTAVQLSVWNSFQGHWYSNGTMGYGITSKLSMQPAGHEVIPNFPTEWFLVDDLIWTALMLTLFVQAWLMGSLPYQQIECKTVDRNKFSDTQEFNLLGGAAKSVKLEREFHWLGRRPIRE
ncbi:hypothetical protein M514_07508, partial [Trichuris suis]